MHRRNGHPEKAVEAFDKVMELVDHIKSGHQETK